MKSGGVSSETPNNLSYAREDGIIQKDTPKMRMSEVEKEKLKQEKKQTKEAKQTKEKKERKDKKDQFVPSGLACFSLISRFIRMCMFTLSKSI